MGEARTKKAVTTLSSAVVLVALMDKMAWVDISKSTGSYSS